MASSLSLIRQLLSPLTFSNPSSASANVPPSTRCDFAPSATSGRYSTSGNVTSSTVCGSYESVLALCSGVSASSRDGGVPRTEVDRDRLETKEAGAEMERREDAARWGSREGPATMVVVLEVADEYEVDSEVMTVRETSSVMVSMTSFSISSAGDGGALRMGGMSVETDTLGRREGRAWGRCCEVRGEGETDQPDASSLSKCEEITSCKAISSVSSVGASVERYDGLALPTEVDDPASSSTSPRKRSSWGSSSTCC